MGQVVLSVFWLRLYTTQEQEVLIRLNWQYFGKQCLLRIVTFSLEPSVPYSWSKGTVHFLLPATNTPGIVTECSERVLMFG